MLRTLVKIVVFGVILSLCRVSVAQEVVDLSEASSAPIVLQRTDLKQIKIISSSLNRHILYLRDKNNLEYRIPAMSLTQAERLLQKLREDGELSLHTKPSQKKSYNDVISWK